MTCTAERSAFYLAEPIGRSPRKPKDVQLHRCADYELIVAERRMNIPVTNPARLVLDLYASEANLDVARRGLFAARKKNLTTWTAIDECVRRHARKGRRGIVSLRADLELYSRIGCPETSFEDAIARTLMDAGMVEPELQHWVQTPGGRYRIDLAYPAFRVGIEGKRRAHHLTDQALKLIPFATRIWPSLAGSSSTSRGHSCRMIRWASSGGSAGRWRAGLSDTPSG